jgi:hypothetical protein
MLLLQYIPLILILARVALTYARGDGRAHIAWALERGVYLHPNLEYRAEEGGMFATAPILPNEILALIPKKMEFPCTDKAEIEEAEQCAKEFAEEKSNLNSYWRGYFDSLPADCQNPLCREIDMKDVTIYGRNALKNSFRLPIPIDNSVIMSRRWNTGMRPLMDLFNHHKDAGTVNPTDQDMYVLENKIYTPAGGEVYENYSAGAMMFRDTWVRFGFADTQAEMTCQDMRIFRLGDAAKRVACIADADSNLNEMVAELNLALKYDDMTMIKGVAQWIDRNTRFSYK